MTTREMLTALAIQLQERAVYYSEKGSICAVRAGVIAGVLDFGTDAMAEELRKDYESKGVLLVSDEKLS